MNNKQIASEHCFIEQSYSYIFRLHGIIISLVFLDHDDDDDDDDDAMVSKHVAVWMFDGVVFDRYCLFFILCFSTTGQINLKLKKNLQ